MSKHLKWVPNIVLIVACLAVGYYYWTKSAKDSLSGLKIECGIPSETTGSAEAVSALVNDALNKNGVESLVSAANVLCSGHKKFIGSQLMVIADPARDATIAAYKKFIGGEQGDFSLQEKFRVDDAFIALLQQTKAPFDVKQYLSAGGDLRIYRKYLKDSMGQIDIVVPAGDARPFLIITRETSW